MKVQLVSYDIHTLRERIFRCISVTYDVVSIVRLPAHAFFEGIRSNYLDIWSAAKRTIVPAYTGRFTTNASITGCTSVIFCIRI